MDINKLPSEDQTASSRWPHGPLTPAPTALPQPRPPRLPGPLWGLRRKEGGCRGCGIQARGPLEAPKPGPCPPGHSEHAATGNARLAGLACHLLVLRTRWPGAVGSDPVTSPP